MELNMAHHEYRDCLSLYDRNSESLRLAHDRLHVVVLVCLFFFDLYSSISISNSLNLLCVLALVTPPISARTFDGLSTCQHRIVSQWDSMIFAKTFNKCLWLECIDFWYSYQSLVHCTQQYLPIYRNCNEYYVPDYYIHIMVTYVILHIFRFSDDVLLFYLVGCYG